MSLFPAYSGGDEPKPSTSKDNVWLSNDSFNAGPSVDEKDKKEEVGEGVKCFKEGQNKKSKTKKMEHGASEEDKVPWSYQRNVKSLRRKRKLHKERMKCKKFCEKNPIIEKISDECDLYCIDKTQRMDFLICSTLTWPIKPRYFVPKRNFIGPIYKEPGSKPFQRYFMKRIPRAEAKEKEEKAIKLNEEYNRKLGKDSSVAEWIEFVEFQDEFFVSQNVKYNTGKDRETAIMKKKLCILEKGMHFNPGNEELLSYWMKIANEVLSTDEMLESLDGMIKCKPGSIPLWLSYISVTQQSMSRCTYSSVTESYKKGFDCLKHLTVVDIVKRDSDILDLLYHYCKFLQDSGHWEFLWTILRTNISLNFDLNIDVDVGITDYKVKKFEDEIVCVEGQPIWLSWKMMESLREGLHFLPVTDSENYPQRCVPLDDLFNFVMHFHPDLHLKLMIQFLMLLKVPPLPFNTSITKALFGTRAFWALDYPELILSAAFNTPTSDVMNLFLKFAALLPVGPQYIKSMEGQQEFFEFIEQMFFEFMGITDGNQRIFFGLWWLRFNRWIYVLEDNCLARPRFPIKRIKTNFKDFIKHAENRNNLLYYCEYSLFESAQGNVDTSIKILKTLIAAARSLHLMTDNLRKAAFCQVHRLLSEQYVKLGQMEEAQKVLIHLALSPSHDTGPDTLEFALNKYEDDMDNMVQVILSTPNSLEEILLPQFPLEWIHCYMWLIAISESAVNARTLYEKLDEQLKTNDGLYSNYAREYFCEAMATIFWMVEEPKSLPLTQFIKDGLMQYPENMKILSLVAASKIEDHGLWLAFKQPLLNPPTNFGCVILISVALLRLDTTEVSLLNRLHHLFRQLALNEGKLCSMVHRLRLMFLFDCGQKQLEAAQVEALSSCPWNKSVYKCAITVLPSKLTELTDLMVEKELRIHVTPDEIVEMRD